MEYMLDILLFFEFEYTPKPSNILQDKHVIYKTLKTLAYGVSDMSDEFST